MSAPVNNLSRSMWLMISGWLVWSVCFVLLYAVLYLGCVFMQPPPDRLSALNAILTAIWILHLGVIAYLAVRSWQHWQAAPAWVQGSRGTSDGAGNGIGHGRGDAGNGAGNGAGLGFLASVTLLSNTAAVVGTVWLGIPTLLVPPCPTG